MLRVWISAPRPAKDLAMISARGISGKRRSMAACTAAM